jgi:aspartyl-tRNA(Asn)/glutamyl-tRNA(Gln) amidotransferase subunit A
MNNLPSPLQQLRERLRSGGATPRQLAEEALGRANRNAGRNIYLAWNPAWTLQEAQRVEQRIEQSGAEIENGPLFGLPVSLKDCFDLAGFTTTAGTKFYAEKNPPAEADSAVAARLREQGAVIIGKTHLHPLAYGITGENRDFGDCLQPANPELLTGGSTSGGAASVQEGSAVAAIGTDTGGSIRVPAALCGLAGYRASIDVAWERKLWSGAVHLSQTFDTLGWIFRDLRDGPRLAAGLFGWSVAEFPEARVRIGVIAESFLRDCDLTVRSGLRECRDKLAAMGAELSTFDPILWDEAMSIYAPIQACEAAAIHWKGTAGDFSVFPPPIDERLVWGASLGEAEIRKQRTRQMEFGDRVAALFREHDFLLLPCSPMSRMEAHKDHTETRTRILRYTVPLSIAGTPVVTLPFAGGAGMQLAAARGEDARLLAFAAKVGSPATHP